MIYIITIFVFNFGCGCHQQWEVSELNKKMGKSTNGSPAIVVQYAKLEKKNRSNALFYLN
jgi:hypothetical protein